MKVECSACDIVTSFCMNQMTKSLHIRMYCMQVHLVKNSYTMSIISLHFINDIWLSDLYYPYKKEVYLSVLLVYFF